MNISNIGYLIAGLMLLILGAEALVRGASRLAIAAGISPLVVGLTVVAFGTSAPELAISMKSSLSGQADIGLGNVVGSNIFNVLAILGVSALITPLTIANQLVRFDVPLMIAISILTLLCGLDGKISQFEGSALALGLFSYTLFIIRQSQKQNKEIKDEYQEAYGSTDKKSTKILPNLGLIVFGLISLILGARWFTQGAVSIAEALGVSQLVIGLTIVAVGTSLPEVATSILATIRGEKDIAVGNVVGSNIFNILCVLGLSSLVTPQGMTVSPAAINFDIPIMIAVAVSCLPIFFTGFRISRWEGLLFISYYIAYVAYLILKSKEHDLLQMFSQTMLLFAFPLTFLGLALTTIYAIRARTHQQKIASST